MREDKITDSLQCRPYPCVMLFSRHVHSTCMQLDFTLLLLTDDSAEAEEQSTFLLYMLGGTCDIDTDSFPARYSLTLVASDAP